MELGEVFHYKRAAPTLAMAGTLSENQDRVKAYLLPTYSRGGSVRPLSYSWVGLPCWSGCLL